MNQIKPLVEKTLKLFLYFIKIATFKMPYDLTGNKKNHNTVVVGRHPNPIHFPGVPLSWCPSIPVFQCPGLTVSKCPNVIYPGGMEK